MAIDGPGIRPPPPNAASRVDLVLTGATIVDPDGLNPGIDVLVRDGVIVDVVPTGTAADAGAEVVACAGRLVVPAYANVHHHFATGLLRGAPPPATATRNQRERLERVIWPFERRLTPADVRAAIRAGLLEAIAAGTTITIDHHVGSRCIPGVLDLIAEEVAASGTRAVLCYEITDRDGAPVAAAGLAETERFLRSLAPPKGLIRGMVGLHAMSTVGPATLGRAVALGRRFDVGLHLHLGESDHDNADSVARYGGRPVARLDAAGGLSPRTLAAHAIHLSAEEVDLLAERNVPVAHNPRSNASNAVGVADLERLLGAGIVVGVGGDGFTQDIRAELDLIPLLQRQEQRDPTALSPAAVIGLGIVGSAAIVERLTGWRLGRVAPGHLADLVSLSYDPVVPLRSHNALWHYARGFPGAQVRDAWVAGRALLRYGAFQTLDAERIRHETAHRSETVWASSGA